MARISLEIESVDGDNAEGDRVSNDHSLRSCERASPGVRGVLGSFRRGESATSMMK